MDLETGLPGGSAGARASMDCENSLDLTVATVDDEVTKTPSAKWQAREIETTEAKDITEGEKMYLISTGWWSKWCAYTRFKQPAPHKAAEGSAAGEDGSDITSDLQGLASPCDALAEAPDSIDNRDIVVTLGVETKLRDNLEEGEDFVIVTAESWSLLHSWYGGGPVITRTAVMEGLAPHTKRPRVMLYPMKLEVYWGGKPDEVKNIEAEKHDTVRSLKERACAAFGVDPDKVEVWDYFNNGKYACLEKQLDQNLDAARILDEQPILLDDKDNPLPENNTTSSSPIITVGSGRLGRHSSFAEDQTIQRESGRAGLVGLQNLGNTCFMNSSLQCLMHSVPIMRVFLSGLYELDINTVNPLGLKGQLALALGNLISNVWKPGVGSVMPRAFKSKVAQFAPQFSGYQQHDSQEFLAFLLDGLHEDINRIQQKPYIEEPDSEGVPDEQLVERAWTNYRLRNDSHIVDHFQGLYKSTLVCPQCSYSSVKFDPFMYLSLPLPESRIKQLTAILLHADGAAAPREYGLEIPQSGTLKDLYVALARVAGLPPLTHPGQQMVAAKLRQAQFGGLTSFEDPTTRISELGRESQQEVLLVYYYRDPEDGPDGHNGDNRKVLVFHRTAGSRGSDGKFSAPLLLWLPQGETYDPLLHVRKLGGSTRPLLGAGGGRLLGGADVEYGVTDKAPIWRHVQRMMQPFQAPPALWQQQEQDQHEQQQQQQQQAPPATSGGAQEAAGPGSGGGGGPPEPAAQQDGGAGGQPEPQPAVSAGPADVSMAAASGLPASPSPEPCSTSQPHGAAAGTAAGAVGASSVSCSGAGGAWGSDGGARDPSAAKAPSEAGDNNSTWGSHGSDLAVSEMDIGDLACDEAVDEAIGISRAASQQELADAAAAAAPTSGAVVMESDGELDGCAALAAQQMGVGSDSGGHSSPTAAGGGSGGGAGGGGSTGLLVTGGVQVAPLDIWAGQQQTVPEPMTAGQQQQQQDQEHDQDQDQGGSPDQTASGSVGPFYVLKLARDGGDSTLVQSWFAQHFHPHHHHFTYILDWQRANGVRVSHAQYLAAGLQPDPTSGAEQQPSQPGEQLPGHPQQQQQQQQQQEQHRTEGQQQSQQPLPQPQQHLMSQQDHQQLPLGASVAGGGQQHWLPDPPALDSSQPDSDQAYELVGRYVLDGMMQPQIDASARPIRAARTDPRGKVVTLEACVEAFLQPEQLSEADEWYCPKCKTHVQADKKLDLWALPEVLVVHLKRFSYTRWNRDKLDTQVLFPLEGLDLSRYVLGATFQKDPSLAPLYDCYAVSNHYGGLGGGHYTAFAQMPDDKKWYLFDDSRVEEAAPENVQSRAAYMLFYRRRAQSQADSPDLVQQLLHQRQQHLAAKEAAAQQAAEQEAAAAAAAHEAAARATAGFSGAAPTALQLGGPDTMAVDTESPLAAVPPPSPAAAAAMGPATAPGLVVDPAAAAAAAGTMQDGWGSPAVGTPAGEGIGGALLGIQSPAPVQPPPPAPASRAGPSGRPAAAVEGSSDTSTSMRNTALEEATSSDGSSSRLRPRGAGTLQQQRQAAEAQATAEAVDSWALQQGSGQQQRPPRRSDQNVDADMADRDA